MITSLSIKNFALIEDVNLSLQHGFTIITGETGAGKSILLGALSLLLGKRADLDSIKNPGKKCIIEGVFDIEKYDLQLLFDENDLDYEPQTIIRREILPSGKSRAFVNDSPVNLQQLGELGKQLVDIHSQHETLYVGHVDYQYKVVDGIAGNYELLKEYAEAYGAVQLLKKKLKNLQENQKELKQTYDYNLFQLNELKQAEIKIGMQETLEAQQQELSNVETLKENLSASLFHLQQEEVGVETILREIKSRLAALENFGVNYQSLSERAKSILLEIEDMTIEIERLQNNVEDDPETLQYVNDKLQQLYNLHKKHATSSEEELLALQQELENKVAVSENADGELKKLNQAIEKAERQAKQWGAKLYQNRKDSASTLTKSIEGILHKLGMPEAKLNIEVVQGNELFPNGIDVMKWKFSANKGGNFNELKKVASGGELSRITLAIKSILASYSDLPTIVFDEVDTGVSGEVAQKMGDIMKAMGDSMQVIAITHLPQIAAKGEHHYKVYKETGAESTQTKIVQLSTEQRIHELAEMLGGKEINSSAIAHAKALLA